MADFFFSFFFLLPFTLAPRLPVRLRLRLSLVADYKISILPSPTLSAGDEVDFTQAPTGGFLTITNSKEIITHLTFRYFLRPLIGGPHYCSTHQPSRPNRLRHRLLRPLERHKSGFEKTPLPPNNPLPSASARLSGPVLFVLWLKPALQREPVPPRCLSLIFCNRKDDVPCWSSRGIACYERGGVGDGLAIAVTIFGQAGVISDQLRHQRTVCSNTCRDFSTRRMHKISSDQQAITNHSNPNLYEIAACFNTKEVPEVFHQTASCRTYDRLDEPPFVVRTCQCLGPRNVRRMSPLVQRVRFKRTWTRAYVCG